MSLSSSVADGELRSAETSHKSSSTERHSVLTVGVAHAPVSKDSHRSEISLVSRSAGISSSDSDHTLSVKVLLGASNDRVEPRALRSNDDGEESIDASSSSQSYDDESPPSPSPMPWKLALLVCMIVLANTLNRLIIFPFLPFMVHDFYPELSKTEIGYRAGYLGAAFSFGGFFGSFIWGMMSDKFGRRPILISGLVGSMVFVLAFGFSTSFYMAVAARFLWGLLNGNAGVAKTFLAEVSDNSNQAKGFAMLGTLSGVGRLMGPAVGGFLANPASPTNPLHSSLGKVWLFQKYPYCLPTLVAGAFTFVSLIGVLIFLPETLPNPAGFRECCFCCFGTRKRISSAKKYKKLKGADADEYLSTDMDEESSFVREVLEGDDAIALESGAGSRRVRFDSRSDSVVANEARLGIQASEVSIAGKLKLSGTHLTEQELPLISSDDGDSHIEEANRPIIERADPYATDRDSLTTDRDLVAATKSGHDDDGRVNGGGGVGSGIDDDADRDSDVDRDRDRGSSSSRSVSCMGLMRDRNVMITVTLFMFCAFLSNTGNEIFPLWVLTEKEEHGFAFDSHEIGIILTILGPLQVVGQLGFPWLTKKFGYLKTMQLSLLVAGVACIGFPFLGFFNHLPKAPTFAMLTAGYWIVVLGRMTAFTCVFVLISNASTVSNRGTVNGLGQSLASIGSMLVLGRMTAFTCVFVLISNASTVSNRGTVNGLGQSLASIGRTVGPIFGGNTIAWSMSNNGAYPLNWMFTWHLVALLTFVLILEVRMLPESVNHVNPSDGTAQKKTWK